MFSAKTYTARRHELRTKIGSGIILLPGNSLSPNNYPNNAYYFRQDSSFRYYFGLNVPSVVGVIDADTGEEALYGDDFTVEDIIWTGPQPTLREMGAGAGVTATFPMAELEKRLRRAISLGRRVHYLPPYRGETKLQLSALLGIKPALLHDYKSVDLMFAVAEMREKKSAEEVEEMERAFRIGYEMHTTAMRMCRPGVVERQIAGAIEGVAKSQGQGVSFPSIVSQHGETLHNLNADGVLEEGRLLLCDAGGETVEGYCSDHTRTYPVSGRFTQKQKDIYNIVLAAHDHVARIVKPHMMYTEVHNAAYMTLAEGLVGLGLLKGSAADAVAAGAMTMFMPHGLGDFPVADDAAARLRGDGREVVRLRFDRRTGRRVGNLRLPRGVADRTGDRDDRRTGSLLHPRADRQVPRRREIQGHRRLRRAGGLPRFRRHPHRGRHPRDGVGQPHHRRPENPRHSRRTGRLKKPFLGATAGIAYRSLYCASVLFKTRLLAGAEKE